MVKIVSAVVSRNKRYMGRPKLPRKSCCKPICSCFKPDEPSIKGLSGVLLGKDEFSALKYHDMDDLSQKEAAEKMSISQPTFARILSSARKKVAGALVKGEKIQIN